MKKLTLLSIAAAAVFAQPAAAQGAQADCVAPPFMVFFDFDSDTITEQGRAILDNAAMNYAACQDAQISIAGHTDTMGDDQHNIGLSQRIATNVASYLVSRGVPAGVITVEAYGETRLLIDTPDGIREPQNRRAEITFGPGSGW